MKLSQHVNENMMEDSKFTAHRPDEGFEDGLIESIPLLLWVYLVFSVFNKRGKGGADH